MAMNNNEIERIAKLAHEVNRAYCKATGDSSIPSWEDAPDWQKDSIFKGVAMHLANPDATPEDSHKSWLKQKNEEGWIYGEVKDVANKVHPCMLPYEQLPETQRAKDYIFKTICNFFGNNKLFIGLDVSKASQSEYGTEAATIAQSLISSK